ncbi:kinesin-like protein KIF19 [Apus apus]|uniref:kinesin-like protein KIF19 n=1 Tax=Apus apus TaxID=8895 RepID=UPI0021F85E82|nr:kinesin-like protein KIF19 [Apus apus]
MKALGDSEDQQLAVALRIRPMSAAELAGGARPIAHRLDQQIVVLQDPTEAPRDVLHSGRSREKSYVFDMAFDSLATQETVYCATTRGLIEGVISGYSATVFAYGPTGCGKTYTMLGTNSEPGICARALGDLFQAIKDTSGDTEYEVTMSYLEIYNEMIQDLLNPSQGHLQLREDASGTIRVPGITEISAISAEEVLQLLARGTRQRRQEPTAANRSSSRSHAVLRVTVRRRHRGLHRGLHRGRALRHGHLVMVDLAGSERAAQTQNRGQRMKEGAHINRSLLALGNCIKALSGQASTKHINYRDSKLTRLLKDSLGGNSYTVMIAHISPASSAFQETCSTLTYACRAKSIRTTAEPVRRLRQSQGHPRLEETPRHRSGSEEQREMPALLRRLHRLQMEPAEPRCRTRPESSPRHPQLMARPFRRHRALCARIILQQRQLLTGAPPGFTTLPPEPGVAPVDAHSLADHQLPVPRPLEELYKTYLQELAGELGDISTLEVGQGGPRPPLHTRKSTSLPKIPQASGTESSPDWDQEHVWAQSHEHPTPRWQGICSDTMCLTGDRHRWVSTTPHVHGAAAVAEGKGHPFPSSSTLIPMLKKPPQCHRATDHWKVSSSTKSIMAKAAQHWSHIPEGTHQSPPEPTEEQHGHMLWQAGSGDRLVGTATSPGAWWWVHKKDGGEPGKRGASPGGRRTFRRSRSFKVTSCEVGAGRGTGQEGHLQLPSPSIPLPAERPSWQPRHRKASPVPGAAHGIPVPVQPGARATGGGQDSALPVPNPPQGRDPNPEGLTW